MPNYERGFTRTPAWLKLDQHRRDLAGVHVRDLFAEDSERFARFATEAEDVLLDWSKNLLSGETMRLLWQLAEEKRLSQWIEHMFAGEPINNTEQRPVLHTALRNRSGEPVRVAGEDVMPEVQRELGRMRELVTRLHAGNLTGATGKAVTDVVNIGIGGSDLGPVMAVEALADYRQDGIGVHFVSNIDGVQLQDLQRELDPESTLFVVCSKSFTTLETLTNARAAHEWLGASPARADIGAHFVAVSSNAAAMDEFGIAPGRRFMMWDWVGGRYSLWSTVGLVIAIAIGMDRFEQLLAGGHAMDQHFRTAPLAQNLPVILAMVGIWNLNFLGAESHAVLPYDQRLHRLPAYLQQLEMESNGKRVSREGETVDYSTGAVIWGEPGNNAQHSFYQLLHQGTRRVSADLLCPVNGSGRLPGQHELTLANCLAQSQALMAGQTSAEVRRELAVGGGGDEAAIRRLLPHKVHPGDRPCTTILFRRLDPATLGKLIALYEHKVFAQGVIWGVNSFDQWGVELGKRLAGALVPAVRDPGMAIEADSSTRGLLDYVGRWRERR